MKSCRSSLFVASALAILTLLPLLPTLVAAVDGDLLDLHSALQERWEETLLDTYGNRLAPDEWIQTRHVTAQFIARLANPEARALWNDYDRATGREQPTLEAPDTLTIARWLGTWQGRLQHSLALEMLAAQRARNFESARAWRALIQLPKHANAVEGALILQRLAESGRAQEKDVSQLLTREFLVWQTTRVREKLDYLDRLLATGEARALPALVTACLAEISALADFPSALKGLVVAGSDMDRAPEPPASLYAEAGAGTLMLAPFERWRQTLETALPNLLKPEEVARDERLLLKLMRLIPKEYQAAGVRDGQVSVPLEYRHTRQFAQQAQNLVSELIPSWRNSRADALRSHGTTLLGEFDALEKALDTKADLKEVTTRAAAADKLLEKQFGLTLTRQGSKENIVAETALEVTQALSLSQAAARAGKWAEAEAQRLEAYVTLDLDIEKRLLPRDPDLALRLERAFLDGSKDQPGIKAALDARLRGPALAAAYERAAKLLDEGVSMLKVSLSPAAITFTTVTILAREGLEAVVVLAALLAGMRGAEQAPTRRRIAGGAWLALAVTALTFWLSKTLISSLSRWGERLEAVISVLAVLVLLIVTNWVFHKFYWVGWNAKIRSLSKAAQNAGGDVEGESRWETLALIGVGFLTIYREGFETVLFLQTFILEGGLRPVLIGLLLGGVLVATLGALVFTFGAKLPYRKLLVITGLLVVSILTTVIGQTVRLFQTVGWLPVHPIPGVELPAWAGIWLGLYSSWEGLLIPLLGLVYVAGAWLWVKIGSLRKQAVAVRAAETVAPTNARELVGLR